MHADAAIEGAGMVFHPAGVESVAGLELAPVGQRCAFERPTGGTIPELASFDLISLVGIAMAAGALFLDLVEDAEISGRGGRVRGTDGNRHGKQDIRAFHDIGPLSAEGNLDLHLVGIGRQLGGAIVGVVGGKSGSAGHGAGTGRQQHGCRECSGKGQEEFQVHGQWKDVGRFAAFRNKASHRRKPHATSASAPSGSLVW